MSDVVVVCLTVLMVVLIGAASYLYLAITERQHQTATENKRAVDNAIVVGRIETAVTAVQDVSDKLQNAPLAAAVSAHGERIAIMEAALKAAIAQMVNVAQYSEDRHKQLVAAQVRGQTAKRPGAPA